MSIEQILLIEDDIDLREAIEDVLLEHDYQVETASNGKLGLKKLQESPFDLVICDIVMPEMDGIEFLQQLTGTGYNGKTLMVSGGGRLNTVDYLMIAESLDADLTLQKPFSLEQLLNAIKELEG
jgi:DNA-binding response OmpR family regulator